MAHPVKDHPDYASSLEPSKGGPPFSWGNWMDEH